MLCCLAHLVVVALLTRRELPLKLHGHVEIKVPVVPLVGLHCELADDLFARLDGEIIVQIKHCLFPVSVSRLRGCGEACALVAFGELDIEVGDEGVDVVVATDLT